MKLTTKILVACLPGIVSGALLAATTGDHAVNKPNEAAMSKVKDSLAKLPLSFEPNRGQTDPRVQFLSRGPGYTVFFTKDETVLTLKDTKTSNAVVRMRFVGGTNAATPTPIDALPGKTNYLIGNDSSKWISGVDEYTKLRYENVYPGIDVLYHGEKGKNLRFDFIVKPGADASVIQMAYEGADKIAVNDSGDLVLTIAGKKLVTSKPFTYQEDGGVKKEVASHFVVKDGRVSVVLAKYDTTKDVIVDPSVIFVTYLGGLLNDSVNGVAIANPTLTTASQPSAYFVTGTTNSTNFPSTSGVAQAAKTGDSDAFVTKINFTGSTILWSTYLGGNSQDSGNAIALDLISSACAASGCPIVVGQTYSANFPTMPFQGSTAAAPPGLSGTNDAFATKLAANGTAILYSTYLGGTANDLATGVATDLQGNVYVGGYTDSPYFLCPGGIPGVSATSAPVIACANSNHNQNTQSSASSDAFLVKIPVSYSATSSFSAITSTLYGGFGEEFAHALAYNPTSNMVYLAGDTTTGAQNFITPNNVNLPGITNNTANQYTVNSLATGLPGPGPNARGGFVVAFDANTLLRTFASYVAVSASTGTCTSAGVNVPCNQGWESITGIAAEGGAPATGCSASAGTCAGTSTATATISATFGNVGHIYIGGYTTSVTPSANIAYVAPAQAGFACSSPIIAASTNAGGPITGPGGVPVVIPGGQTVPAGCTTALYTQTPFATNQAPTSGCPFPLPSTFVPTPTCNFSAYVAILDGALLTAPVSGAPAPTGNQIEYWAYYSSSNASTVANALAIDSNPTTLSSVYSLGTYQQMYITGSTMITSSGANGNALPVTNALPGPPATSQELFVSYNVGTTTGGGVGGYTPKSNNTTNNPANEVDAFVARFNPNGLADYLYGGKNQGLCNNAVCPTAIANLVPGASGPAVDRSPLIHTPQFNYGEFLYSQNLASTAEAATGATPQTVGNAIAVDPTRAVLIGGVTNVLNGTGTSVNTSTTACTAAGTVPAVGAIGSCGFTTTNALPAVGFSADGGTDGWVSVLFFNDILSNAGAQASANPFLQPGFVTNTVGVSYIETTPPPFGPTFDFAISDLATQTQTFQVLFTGQAAGQLLAPTPWFVPLDPRSGANPPTIDNGLPGSGIVYYLPCNGPNSNAYPAPGGAYGPLECAFPSNDLYESIPTLFSGFPGIPTNAQSQPKTAGLVTPGWLIVSQDINPGVVRLQLDRRAAAGLLEGTYVAQFLVTTLDSQHNTQWPPCGPQSVNNPFVTSAAVTCTNATTPLPADNVSILVTVRLVVRPTLFLSRNAGILTGVTSNLAAAQLSGPSTTAGGTTLTQQQGTSAVPDWYFTGATNDITTWPGTAGSPNYGLDTIINAGTNGVNSGPAVCQSGDVPGTTVANSNLGAPFNTAATIAAGVLVPCPPTNTAAFTINSAPPVAGSTIWSAATAYALNGPGDFSGGTPVYSPGLPNLASVPTAATPNMTFLYDAGTILTQSTGPLTGCSINPCYLGIEQGLAATRPDQPAYAGTAFNSEWQGGQDPLTQRNDATVHDYYVTAEGPATLSIAAVNCTHWTGADKNPAVGNWLAAELGAADGVTSHYTPICNASATATTVGQSGTAMATLCPAGCTYTPPTYTPIGDDNPTLPGGQVIPIDILTKAFSDRPQLNGIPTGLYTATVYVWSTRAKNSVPGYCLGASMPASPNGVDPLPLCGPGSSSAIASSSNPNPEVTVTVEQTFNVTLSVFDTTQTIQITPNICPTPAISNNLQLFSTVANPENLFTGNVFAPFGPGSIPNYPNFGQNGNTGQQLVEWSLLPFQTTGTSVTGCFVPNSTCPNGNLTPIPLPTGVSVNAETLAQYNSCALPTGSFNGQTTTTSCPGGINGSCVPGIGTLSQTGPISQTTFIPAGNGSNTNVTIYACRPTVTPAWLNSPLYPGNTLFPQYVTTVNGQTSNAFAVEPYANGNGPNGGPNAASVTGAVSAGIGPVPSVSGLTCPIAGNATGTGTGTGGCPGTSGCATATSIGVFRPGTTNGSSFLLDTGHNNAYVAGTSKFIQSFLTGTFNGISAAAGDIGVAGDWNGTGHSSVGVYRPSTGQWFLDANGDGVYDAGDFTYFFGGLTAGGNVDTPVVGDWSGTGKSCIGISRNNGSGIFWLLDLNCNGTFDNTPTDAFFPFGGISGDVPVVGAWTGGAYRVGVVRKYAPGGVPVGAPFFWVLDAGSANAGNTPAAHPACISASQTNCSAQTTPFAFGGLVGDTFITGDWLGTGISRAGVYRTGNWLEDTAGAHTYDTFYQFGGLATDQPVLGKW
jgi:hypothetical protein